MSFAQAAKSCFIKIVIFLNWWLGPEGITLLRERDFRAPGADLLGRLLRGIAIQEKPR